MQAAMARKSERQPELVMRTYPIDTWVFSDRYVVNAVLTELTRLGLDVPKDYIDLLEMEPFRSEMDSIPVEYGRKVGTPFTQDRDTEYCIPLWKVQSEEFDDIEILILGMRSEPRLDPRQFEHLEEGALCCGSVLLYDIHDEERVFPYRYIVHAK